MRNKHLTFKRLRFYNQNKDHINTIAASDDDWRSPKIREFVEQARSTIGYSAKTSPCDIYTALMSLTPTWKERKALYREQKGD